MYKHRIIQVVLAVVIIGTVLFTATQFRILFTAKTAVNSGLSPTPVTAPTPDDRWSKMMFTELHRSDSKIFYCGYIYGGATCRLIVGNSDGTSKSDLGILFDNTEKDGHAALQPSRDGRYVLVVREYALLLIDSNSLEQRVLYEAEAGMALGLYTEYPTFIPHAQWVSETEIEVSLFKDGTVDPYDDGQTPAPISVKKISI